MSFDSDYRPGDVVSVRFGGVLRHYGVVTHGGRVVSNTRRHDGIVSQTIAEFARGRPVKWHGQKGSSGEYLASSRADRLLGREYDLTGSNCIDFARHAQGRKPTINQIARGTLMAFGDMLGARKPRR